MLQAQQSLRELCLLQDSPIEALLQKTSELSGVPRDDQRIIYCSKELRPVDEHGKPLYLSDYNIQDEGNLFLVLRLLGGGQKHPADNKQCSCPRLVYFNKLSETRHTWDSLKKQASNSANTEPVPAPSKGSVYVYDYKVARTNNKQPTPTTMNVPGPPEGKESKPYRPNSEQAHGECWQRTEVVEGRPPNVHFEATKTELNVSKQVGGRDHLKTTLAQISTQSNGASKRTERDVGNERKGKISNSEVHLHLSKPRKKPAPPIPETTSKTLYREETPDTPKSQVQTKPTKLEGKSKSPADNRTPKKSEDDPNLLDSENSEETPKPPDPDPDESLAPPKLYGPDVQLTQMPDMFTLDDDEGGQRALMPCKHAIGPESLTAYCRSLLTAGMFEFRCPYKANPSDPFCDQLWEFFIVKKLAVLTKYEIEEFEIKIAENYLRKAVGIQECPGCKSFCERRSKKNRRVVCPICRKKKGNWHMYEFCWYCLKPWRSSAGGEADCGNVSCTGQDPRIRILKTCPTKVVVGVSNCPAIRACPKCGLLIQHKAACKHMLCPCKQRFCFICLKLANSSGRYKCGAYNFKCTVAPRQTSVPGD